MYYVVKKIIFEHRNGCIKRIYIVLVYNFNLLKDVKIRIP